MLIAIAFLLSALPNPSPDHQIRTCLQFVDTLNANHAELCRRQKKPVTTHPDIPYYRFVSWHGLPDDYIEEVKALSGYLVNSVSTAKPLVFYEDVPLSGGLVGYIDIRHPYWTKAAVSAVYRRDKLFTEPYLSHTTTQGLRTRLGITQDIKTLHSEGIVWGPWLMRRLLQSGLGNDYYDLLYSQQRFPDIGSGTKPQIGGKGILKSWPGGKWTDGMVYQKDAFTYTVEPGGTDPATGEVYQPQHIVATSEEKATEAKLNFPANETDWNDFHGIKISRDFFAKSGQFSRSGDIVQGFLNSSTGKGSYVSYQDRAIEFEDTPYGLVMKTYDNRRTAGDRNYINKIEGVARGQIKADANEYIAPKANKIPAYLLSLGDGTRQEIADADVVRNSKDGKSVVVRTQIGCITCHAPTGGIISPTNSMYKDAFVHGGVRRVFKDNKEKKDVEEFFRSRELEYKGQRELYFDAVKRSTTTNGFPKGMTGVQLSAAVLRFRTWYDTPVTAEQAAKEFGLSTPVFQYLAMQSVDTSLKKLADGQTVPRSVWEDDLVPLFGLIFDATVDKPDPIQRIKSKELLLDLQRQILEGKMK